MVNKRILVESTKRKNESFSPRGYESYITTEIDGSHKISWPAYGAVSISEAKAFAKELQKAIDYVENAL